MEFENQKIKEIAEKNGVDIIMLFGSRAVGNFRPNSDFDIAYFTNSNFSYEQEGKLFTDLSDVFGTDRIDLLNIKKIKPLILYEIMRNAKVLFARDMLRFYEIRAYAFNRFQDEVKPLFKMKFERLKEKYLS